jgi:hypothetical protein
MHRAMAVHSTVLMTVTSFRDSCLEMGVLWSSGDRDDAKRFLVQLGIAYWHSSGSLELVRHR